MDAITVTNDSVMDDREGIMPQRLSMLLEGSSLRATTRMADCSITTVSKLLLDVRETVSGNGLYYPDGIE